MPKFDSGEGRRGISIYSVFATVFCFFGRELALAYSKVGAFYLTRVIVAPFMDGVFVCTCKCGWEHNLLK